MAANILRLIRHCAEFCPQDEIAKIPDETRGIYALLHHNPKQGEKAYNVVYIGMSRRGVKGRLMAHRRSRRKSGLWTHFSVYSVWPNITDGEIEELEGLFRAICVWQLVLAHPWQLTLAHPLVSYVNDPRLTAGKGCRGRAA